MLRGVKRSQTFSPSLQAALVNIHPVLLSFYYDYFLFEQEAGGDTAKEKKTVHFNECVKALIQLSPLPFVETHFYS